MFHSEGHCSAKLKALADETRWQIVALLLHRPMTVSAIARGLEISQYNISKHLRILREAGIILTAKEGRHVRSEVSPDYRDTLKRNESILDFGCCQFHFCASPLRRQEAILWSPPLSVGPQPQA